MSGGHWDYLQYRLTDVAEDIGKLIDQNGQLKSTEELKEERWNDDAWYEKYPEEKFHYKYSDEVIQQFKHAEKMVWLAQTYMQRLDWLLSGDDGEESFIRRLDEDLKKLDNEQNSKTSI